MKASPCLKGALEGPERDPLKHEAEVLLHLFFGGSPGRTTSHLPALPRKKKRCVFCVVFVCEGVCYTIFWNAGKDGGDAGSLHAWPGELMDGRILSVAVLTTSLLPSLSGHSHFLAVL